MLTKCKQVAERELCSRGESKVKSRAISSSSFEFQVSSFEFQNQFTTAKARQIGRRLTPIRAIHHEGHEGHGGKAGSGKVILEQSC
jgi:hypothetical protein